MPSTECPICSRHVRLENLPLHVETCLTKQQQQQKKQQLESPLPSSSIKFEPHTSSSCNRSTPRSESSFSALKKRKHSTYDDISAVPLAERMRPKHMDDLVGQDDLLGPRSLLATLIQADQVPNMIIWGNFFLPSVEDGTITLIGATTENPSFEVNNALLSRCRVFTLKKHSPESIETILRRAVRDHAAGVVQSLTQTQEKSNDDADSAGSDSKEISIEADDEAIDYLAKQCAGDARAALNCLEMAIQTAPMDAEKHVLHVTATHVHHCFAHRQTLFYDRNADMHYDCISALHKSVRGSDENATLYWLARMLEGGENALYVARRLIRIASEDVGLAAPELLPMAVSAYQAAHFIGMPECDVVLAHVATMLARAPKSVEVYAAYKRAKQTINEWDKGALPDVPLHLRNAPTRLMKQFGYGKEYKYNPHYSADELKDQTYLPDELAGRNFFEHNDADRDAC
ncbi:hypothetical protein DD238_002917 [Peronospora effusa]|uniref:UBZ4-type domain-containing protein n=1 Tax=Peronospora effusa TaxID=542832 RepID=A0A3M6VFL6_9STRA|nr:hypothetical protein DD238_002917 [Peronospora effusa]